MIQIISQRSFKTLKIPPEYQSFYACFFDVLPNPQNRFVMRYREKKTSQEACASVQKQDEGWVLDSLLVPYAFENGKLEFSPKRRRERHVFYQEVYEALLNLGLRVKTNEFALADQGELNEELCQAQWPLFYDEESQGIYVDVSCEGYNAYRSEPQVALAGSIQ